MPQSRRKTPFSGKAKKEQLKAKRQTKTFKNVPLSAMLVSPHNDEGESSTVQNLNFQPVRGLGGSNVNRYVLKFHKETEAEIKNGKEEARHSVVSLPEEALEFDGSQHFPDDLDFPKRPEWNFDMSKDVLEAKEQRYFTQYISAIESRYSWSDLSYFELNLETWRQLWRVIEMSDIVLFIVDIRYAGLMFPPSIYKYVCDELKKSMILVLNKIDLAPAPLVAAWKNYFNEKYPQLKIVMFTTLPGYNLVGKQQDKAGLQIRKRKGRLRMAAEGTQVLYDACKSIVGDQVDLSSWQQKIKEEMTQEFNEGDHVEIESTLTEKNDVSYYQHERFKDGVLTIGCIGQPNVGKSSLMNALMGKKVVSVSRTPGHTKHFQTIFLTKCVKLCDCPGLVFPSKVSKVNQVLMGSFPIAQLREPFSTLKYLAERLDLPSLLRIQHPENDTEWSTMDICEGWALKRGYRTAKAARLDAYRAANSLLRLTLDGKICLCLRPPLYLQRKEFWEKHPDTETVKWIQARSNPDVSECAGGDFEDEISSSENEEEPNPKESEQTEASKVNNSSDGSDSESSVDGTTQFTSNNFAALQLVEND